MNHNNKMIFVAAIVKAATEAANKAESSYKRGFLTNDEKETEVLSIIQAAAELVERL